MIVNDQHQQPDKRSLLDENDTDSVMSKQSTVEDGLPVYAPVDPNSEMKGKETPAPQSNRGRKIKRAIKFCLCALLAYHLYHFVHHRFDGPPRFGFWHGNDHDEMTDSKDVTDEWVNGRYNFAHMDYNLATAEDTNVDIWTMDEVFPVPPDHPDMPHPPEMPDNPDMPPMPPHSPHMPDEPDHPAPPRHPSPPHHPPPPRHHPPPHPPHHHVTVECLSTEGESTALTMQLPFTPSDDGYLPAGAVVDLGNAGLDWTEPVSFNLSTSLRRLVVASHGPVAGSVHLHTDSSLSDTVTYNVTVSDPSVVKICKLLHEDVFFGVAVVAPHERVHPVPRAKIDVWFPSEADINAFTSHTGVFHHDVDDLSGVQFGKFQLGASNAALHVDTVNAKVAVLKTVNAAIDVGTVSGKLVVLTTNNGRITGVVPNATAVIAATKNAPITLNATVWSTADGETSVPESYHAVGCHQHKEEKANTWASWFTREARRERRARRKARKAVRKAGKHWHGHGHGHAAVAEDEEPHDPHGPHGPHHKGDGKGVLVATSTNGHIDVHAWLKSNTTGVFSVVAKSSNTQVEVGVLDQPVNSTLSLTATSTNGRIGVGLHPAFEGEFIARTTNGKSELIETPNVNDPAGLHRVRHITVSRFANILTGSAFWGEKKKRGSAVLSTTNAGVQLAI
ncbi:hypothetical protein DACRYDRAFT_105370 [Dacryopinax primogenitus]|uniref:Adhesin domain-containing protein n=1 Tax=Dacryopinax primogenitus (strain DJM 731) TaxID=1858805 RepID=M5GFP9_DACPD|nr:uncharacterized protein DACRYDRAFT_105370 [Dacryopinax primogenitus]EJU04308.1 hypothetical protein DACRYDRAFT_105370 [Dacryopinax primogenitus]